MIATACDNRRELSHYRNEYEESSTQDDDAGIIITINNKEDHDVKDVIGNANCDRRRR